MVKKQLILLTVLAGLGLGSCGDKESTDDGLIFDGTIEKQIEVIKGLSYSQLTADQQKIKLEADAQEVLDEMSSMKSSPAVDAFDNLEALLKLDKPDLSKTAGTKATTTINKLLSITDVYGIYVWNATTERWDKNASTTEFKFSFPSKKDGKTNDAVADMTSKSSGITYVEKWEDYQDVFDNAGRWLGREPQPKSNTFDLASEAEAKLSINGALVATAKMSAEYANNLPVPEKVSSSVTFHDYTIVAEGKQGTPDNEASSKFTYKGKVIFEAVASGTIDLKKIADNDYTENDSDYNYFGTAKSVIKVMNNLVVVAEGDIKSWAAKEEALSEEYQKESYSIKTDTPTYYKEINAMNKKSSEATANNFNNSLKNTLASRKDFAKIAELIMKSEKNRDYEIYSSFYIWNERENSWTSQIFDEKTNSYRNVTSSDSGVQTYERYDEVYYLRFNDNTLVSLDTYFSSGFSKFTDNWNEFLKSFQKK